MNRLKLFSKLGIPKNSPRPLFKCDYVRNSGQGTPRLLNGVRVLSRLFSAESNPEVTLFLNDEVKVNSYLKIALDAGISKEEFYSEVSESPELLKSSPSQWKTCLSELIPNGFTGSECLRMISAFPDLLRAKPGSLSTSVEHWRSSQLGDTRVISLLKRWPHFLRIDLAEINRRIPLLQSLSSQRNVTNLLKGSPNLMFEKWSEVQAKLEYLENVMKVDRKLVIKTFAFNRSLNSIKTRHVFLERCGKYTTPKKFDPDEPSKNPALSVIINSDDLCFATSVAGVSLEEFEVFQELYSREVQDADDDD